MNWIILPYTWDTKRNAVFSSPDKFRNSFVPNAPFLYPRKASENWKVFWCFWGYRKVPLGTNGLIDFKTAMNHTFNSWCFFKLFASLNMCKLRQPGPKNYTLLEQIKSTESVTLQNAGNGCYRSRRLFFYWKLVTDVCADTFC